MIDKDPSKSMRAITRDTGASEFPAQAGEPSHDCRTISATTSPLTWGQLILQIYYVWGEVEQETPTPCNTKDELKAKSMSAFTNSNKETVQKSCRRFRSRLEAVVEANGDPIAKLYSLVFQDICP